MLQIHYLAILIPERNNPPCRGKVGHVQYSVQCWSGRGLNPQLLTQQTGALADCAYQTAEVKKSWDTATLLLKSWLILWGFWEL